MNTRSNRVRLGWPALLGVAFCSPVLADDLSQRDAVSRRGMVVSSSVEGSNVGAAILKQGGNAVDAAVATAFAMAVAHPSAGNIGGGGFMLIHPSDGRPPVVVDYRERAPLAATRDMFSQGGDRFGHKIVGVPGTIRGLALAHREYGSRAWRSVVQPAVKLAEDGFVLHEGLASSLNRVVRRAGDFPEFVRVYGKNAGRDEWRAGDRLVLPELGRTLRRIAEIGPEDFYTGETADLIVNEMRRGGGLITKRDLGEYEAKLRTPIHTTFRGYDVYGPPPPSSGGICVAQMLNVLENFDLEQQGRWSAQTLHLIIEAMRCAFADRAKHLGDSDFVRIPKHLTTKEYAKRLAERIDRERATPSESLARPIKLAAESTETTHFSVIDATGMAVSNTYTLEFGFGSLVVVPGAGFLLNNEMGDFNWSPGITDRQGRIGTMPNQIEPGKRMLSSMTPLIAAREGKVRLVTGSPGGRTVINTVLCVTLNVLEFNLGLREAIDAPRMDHQWFPERVRFGGADDPAFSKVVTELRAMGHDVRAGHQGDANSILVRDGAFQGAADNRYGKAAGG